MRMHGRSLYSFEFFLFLIRRPQRLPHENQPNFVPCSKASHIWKRSSKIWGLTPTLWGPKLPISVWVLGRHLGLRKNIFGTKRAIDNEKYHKGSPTFSQNLVNFNLQTDETSRGFRPTVTDWLQRVYLRNGTHSGQTEKRLLNYQWSPILTKWWTLD